MGHQARSPRHARSRFTLARHPERKRVVVLRADGTVSVLALHDTLLGDSVLPGVAMTIAELFADN